MIKVSYVNHMGDALTVVNAARVSFGNQKTELDQRDKKLIKYLADHKHMSPFEHLTLTVKVEVPLYIRSQIHRHRTFAYNEISRRYTDKDMTFYVPDILRKQHKSNRQASEGNIDPLQNEILAASMMLHHERALEFYYLLISKGVCKEQARGILPQNLMTEFYQTGNLRNYISFVKLRLHEGAQYEAQLVAKEIGKILLDKFGYAAEVLLKSENLYEKIMSE